MNNLPFVLWMIGFPFVQILSQYVDEYLCKATYSNEVEIIGALVIVFIWAFIGSLLYCKKDRS